MVYMVCFDTKYGLIKHMQQLINEVNIDYPGQSHDSPGRSKSFSRILLYVVLEAIRVFVDFTIEKSLIFAEHSRTLRIHIPEEFSDDISHNRSGCVPDISWRPPRQFPHLSKTFTGFV